MRVDGVEALRYFSARDVEDGTNVALFSPKAFARASPRSAQTWICIADRGRVRFTQKHALEAPSASFAFERTQFEVACRLPAPAL